MEYRDIYDYIVKTFKNWGFEQIKDLKQIKTLISENGIQTINESIPSNVLIYKCFYYLDNWIFYFNYGGKIIIELEKLSDSNTKVIVYGKEVPSGPAIFSKDKIYDIDLILSKLKPPVIKQ